MLENQLGPVRYIPAFDGVRALCITLVITFHVISSDRPWLDNVAKRGWCGVDVFFVLSGFLITWIVADEMDKSGTVNLPRFYARRALRLQPAYLSGLFGFALLLLLFDRERFYIIARELPFFLTYTINLAVALGFVAFPPYGHAWSLCIEEQFYLCWSWTLRRFGTRRCLRIALGVVSFVVVYRTALYAWLNWHHLAAASPRSLDRIYFGTDTRIDTILVGCAAALAMREPALQNVMKRIRDWPWLTAFAAVGLLVIFAWATGGASKGGWRSWRSATIGFTLMALATALVVIALHLQPESMLSRSLSWSPMVSVGKVSYGVYLFHWPVWSALARLTQLHAAGALKQEVAAFLIVWFASVTLAWIHFRVVETRFLWLRSKLEDRLKREPRPGGSHRATGIRI